MDNNTIKEFDLRSKLCRLGMYLGNVGECRFGVLVLRVLTITLAVVVAFGAGSTLDGAELIRNGGFEQAEQFWSGLAIGDGSQAKVVEGIAHSGKHCLMLKRLVGKTWVGMGQALGAEQLIPEKTYVISYWYKGDPTKFRVLKEAAIGGGSPLTEGAGGLDIPAEGPWVQAVGLVKWDPLRLGAKITTLTFCSEYNEAEGATVYIDDVSLAPLEEVDPKMLAHFPREPLKVALLAPAGQLILNDPTDCLIEVCDENLVPEAVPASTKTIAIFDGQPLELVAVERGDSFVRYTARLPRVAIGQYRLRIAALKGSGEVICQGDFWLTRGQPEGIPVRAEGSLLLIHGEPVLLKATLGSLPPEGMGYYKGVLNAISLAHDFGGHKTFLEAENAGLMILVEISKMVRQQVLNADELTSAVLSYKDEPALLGYFIDEPSSGPEFQRRVREAYQIVKRYDPGHPVFVNFVSCDSRARFLADSADVIGTDCYPVPGWPLGVVADSVEFLIKNTQADKPVWFFAQAHVAPGASRAPAPEELRAIVYLSFIGGARGILYYSGCDLFYNNPDRKGSEMLWQQIKQISRELSVLEGPLLLWKPAVVEVSGHGIRFLARQEGEKLVLVLVNPADAPVTVQMILPSEFRQAAVEVLFEKGVSVQRDDGVVSDSLPGISVRVYQFERMSFLK